MSSIEQYEAECVNELQKVVSNSMNIPPPAGNRFTREQQEQQCSGDACISKMIFAFAGRETAYDLWVDALLWKFQKVLEDGVTNHGTFFYNGVPYQFIVMEEDYNSHRPAGFYISVTKKDSKCETEFFDRDDLFAAVLFMAAVVRRDDCCPICSRILYLESELYCRECKNHFNEPGCKTCKRPFGKLEDGEHPVCKKRRLTWARLAITIEQ